LITFLSMTSSLRLLAKGTFLFCVLALLACGLVLAWFASWRADRLAALDSASEVAKTDLGPVEFLTRGEGPAVLVFHGAPGGYDQAMLLSSSFVEGDFQIVAPSRPGYLRTPLATGLSPEQQADAMAALIDQLGISRVAILASSSGAPAAVQFVLRYPAKVWALVLLAAVAGKFDPDAKPQRLEPGRIVLNGFGSDLGSWICLEATERNPARTLSWILKAQNSGTEDQREALENHVLGDLDQLEWFESFVGTFVPLSAREAGLRNDLAQIRALMDLPLEAVRVPTLVVHGTADRCVPIENAQEVAGRIPGAVLYPVEGAGHLVEIGPWVPELQKKIVEFLRQHSAGQAQP
ncbi:MAG TPA: alpha/beta hydrolase, partial [Terrimicrobium sp.]